VLYSQDQVISFMIYCFSELQDKRKSINSSHLTQFNFLALYKTRLTRIFKVATIDNLYTSLKMLA